MTVTSARRARIPSWLQAFRWSAFRRVWTVSTLQQLGYWFSSIAFQWLVSQATHHDPLILSVLYFCMLLPMLLLSLPAGVLADVRDRRRILITTQSAILVISVATGLLVATDRASVWALMACAAAVGGAQSLSQPASQALVANAVPDSSLHSAVMLQAIGMNLARILGPALAGVLILAWGSTASLLTYGAFGLVSLVVLRFVPRALRSPVAAPTAVARRGRVRSGLAHARSRPPTVTALGLVAITSMFGASYVAQLPALAALVSDDPGAFLVLTSIGGVGSLIGVLVVAWSRTPGPSVVPAAVMLAMLAGVVTGLGYSRTFWLEAVLAAAGGALVFGVMTQCGSVIQQVVDDDHRGRVMSLYTLCWGGLLPIGGLILGTVWHFLGPAVAMSGSGTAGLAFAGYVLRPRFRASARTDPIRGAASGGDPSDVDSTGADSSGADSTGGPGQVERRLPTAALD